MIEARTGRGPTSILVSWLGLNRLPLVVFSFYLFGRDKIRRRERLQNRPPQLLRPKVSKLLRTRDPFSTRALATSHGQQWSIHCWKAVVFLKLTGKRKFSNKRRNFLANLIHTKWSYNSSDFIHTPSNHQVTFIELHCLPIIKNKDQFSTELNATDHLSHAKHHKTTKTSNDIDNHRPPCSSPVPFFSR